MFVRGFMFKAIVALGLVALVVLPGEAKPEAAASVSHSGVVRAITAPAAQAAFGLFLDPHAEPVLHIELPSSPWEL